MNNTFTIQYFDQITKYKWNFWYIKPSALEWDEWDRWETIAKLKHPVQYFFREGYSTAQFRIKRNWRDFYYWCRKWFKPAHPIIRKALKREWCDLVELSVDLNLAIILQFKQEADESYIDWTYGNHAIFKKWLDESAEYITKQRPLLHKQLMEAYPKNVSLAKEPYETLYSEVIRIEKLIEDTDTKIIKEMIDYRNYMWT